MMERKAAVRTHVCGILLLAILLVFALFSCGGLYEYKNEVAAMKEFYDYFDDPSQLEISTFDKYAVSKREIYYYTEWSYPFENGSGPFEVLLVYNVKSRQLQLRFFNDMELGLYPEVKSKWDEVKDSPDARFSRDEITLIQKRALDDRNKEQADKK